MISNTLKEKLRINGHNDNSGNPVYDCVLWDEDQIGFFIDNDTIQMCITEEDFENNEIDNTKAQEILKYKEEIEKYLKSEGWTLVY